MLTFYKNQLLIGQEGSSLECLKSDTRTTPTLASTHAQECISSLQLGGSWINGVLDGHLFQVLFPILFYTAYRFLRGNLCLVPVRRFPGLLGKFTMVIFPGRTGGKRLTSSPGLSDPKRIGRLE